jgi:2-deoxy-D-gluconate 3-dehydrogenase
MRDDLFSLAGRVALVTGGSRGIGKMIARGFIAQGAKVYITARKAAACAATAAELSKDGGVCIALPIDISTVQGADELAAAIGVREPKLDILVNNAGAAWAAEMADFPESGWDKVVDLNMKTPFFLTKALMPRLKSAASAERPAKVINIASIDGIFVNPLETYPYAASKAGLIHLTRRMAAKLIEDHIVVTAIAPGPFASDMNKDARAGRTDRRRRRHGGRGDLPRLARRRLCRGLHADRRWRRRLRPNGFRGRALGCGGRIAIRTRRRTGDHGIE